MGVRTWIASWPVYRQLTGADPPGRPLRRVTRPAELSSAALAPAVASYTAALLSRTAATAWHAAHPYLPFVFTGSSADAP
jgi:hypothetical protein